MINNNFEIYISKEALYNLSQLLNKNNYSCVRLSYVKSCCSTGSLDIILDNIIEKDLIYKYDPIIITYDNEVSSNIKKVEIIYKNHDFMMKITPVNTINCKSNCCKTSTSSSCNKECPHKNKPCS